MFLISLSHIFLLKKAFIQIKCFYHTSYTFRDYYNTLHNDNTWHNDNSWQRNFYLENFQIWNVKKCENMKNFRPADKAQEYFRKLSLAILHYFCALMSCKNRGSLQIYQYWLLRHGRLINIDHIELMRVPKCAKYA